MKTRSLAWQSGRAEVVSTAGMLLTAEFELNSRSVRPFARAPWRPADYPFLPGHLRVLGAEFVCLPFGSADVPADAPEEWRMSDRPPAVLDGPPHGLPADLEWRFADAPAGEARLALDLPETSDVARLERTIRGGDGLEFELTVISRRPHRSPVGLHPILRMPDEGEQLTIDARFERGSTYPGTPYGGSALLARGAPFSRLSRVPARDGTALDLSVLPFARRVEEVVQLIGAKSPITVTSSTGYNVDVHWDDTVLQSVLLWFSDGMLDGPPWNRRYRGFGVEPIAAAFDLPVRVSAGLNPLAALGATTAMAFDPERPAVIRSRVSVRSA